MESAFSTGLILPAICLAALGWAVPRLLAIWWAEGVWPLMGLAFVSTLIMGLCGAAFFAALYAVQGVHLGDLYATGGLAVVLHFGRLSLISALLWAPMMLLSVAGIPKNWVKEVW